MAIASGQEHHRDVEALRPPLPAQVEPVGIGQHHVGQHQVGPVGGDGERRLRAAAGGGDLETVKPQGHPDHVDDVRLVVYHQQPWRLPVPVHSHPSVPAFAQLRGLVPAEGGRRGHGSPFQPSGM